MNTQEISYYLNELANIRDWSHKAEKTCKDVQEYSLPIISPMKDLAMPDCLISIPLHQPFFYQEVQLESNISLNHMAKQLEGHKQESHDCTTNSHCTNDAAKEHNQLCMISNNS